MNMKKLPVNVSKVDPFHLESSMAIISLLQFCNLNTLLIIPVLVFNRQFPADLIYVILLPIAIVNIFIINKEKLYDECKTLWKEESEKTRSRNKWLLIVFFVASVFMMFVSIKIVYSPNSLTVI